MVLCGRKAIEHVTNDPELKKLIKIVYLSKTQHQLIELCVKKELQYVIKEKEWFDINYGDKSKYKYKHAIAIIKSKPHTDLTELIENAAKKPKSVIVVLDHLQDPFNLGAILRTCAAAGVSGVVIPKSNQAPINHDATMKASQGYALNLDISVVSNLTNALGKLKKHGYWVYVTNINEESKDFKKIKYADRSVLILGTEGDGVSPLLKKISDFHVYIPMHKSVDSLNVSVAAGVILFEMVSR